MKAVRHAENEWYIGDDERSYRPQTQDSFRSKKDCEVRIAEIEYAEAQDREMDEWQQLSPSERDLRVRQQEQRRMRAQDGE